MKSFTSETFTCENIGGNIFMLLSLIYVSLLITNAYVTSTYTTKTTMAPACHEVAAQRFCNIEFAFRTSSPFLILSGRANQHTIIFLPLSVFSFSNSLHSIPSCHGTLQCAHNILLQLGRFHRWSRERDILEMDNRIYQKYWSKPCTFPYPTYQKPRLKKIEPQNFAFNEPLHLEIGHRILTMLSSSLEPMYFAMQSEEYAWELPPI